ncbi:MAG: S8/S53 family peptidase, partial [Chitinophagales bacterium]
MKKDKIQLIVTAGAGTKGPDDLYKKIKGIDKKLEIKDFVTLKAKPSGKKTKTTAGEKKQFLVETTIEEYEFNAWQVAHAFNEELKTPVSFAEPDNMNEFTIDRKTKSTKGIGGEKDKKRNLDFDDDWKPHENKVWHLMDDFSQLLSARTEVENMPGTITIAHFDTGYDKNHFILPKNLNKNFERSFVEGEDGNDACDRGSEGLLKMPGHGTGTIGILAGNVFKTKDGKFNTEVGAASFAEIIPFRIAKTVVLFRTSTFAQALNHITNLTNSKQKVFHVLTMSMGGSASQAWADAVNAAYEAGIFMATAAGNHFNCLPTDHLIYPSRFNRVVAACGVTYEYKPYLSKKLGEMQGCYGPKKFMHAAMAAFTPNTPWAVWGENSVSFNGAGTSSATPQVAAAAAIYSKKYKTELDKLLPWQRVEAIRYALFNSAKQQGSDSMKYFGRGILKAKNALGIPVDKSKLVMSAKDDVGFFPEFNVIFKAARTGKQNEMKMYSVELAQLVHANEGLRKLLYNEEKTFSELKKAERKKVIDYVIGMQGRSEAL